MCECVFEKNTEPQPWRIENNFLVRESVLFIGTQFSILYTFMYSPA
jgi:hypothetical protein